MQALLGLLFPFLPISSVSHPPLSEWRRTGFLPSRFAAVPGFAHNWVTRLQQGRSGASLVSVPLLGLQNRTQGHTGASLDFLPRTSLPLPLKGEGPGIAFLGFARFALLVHNRATAAQQGLFRALVVFPPYPALKIAHRATQGQTGPSLVLMAFSCCPLGLAGLTSSFSACSLPPPGWDG